MTASFLESNTPCGFDLSEARVHLGLGTIWIKEYNIGKMNYFQNTVVKVVK
jgi:hypothetical protein